MTDPSRKVIDELVADLSSSDAVVRVRSRSALVNLGAATVPAVLKALDAPMPHTRWEAAKTLAQIPTATASKRLVEALGDEESDVRWVVGEALIALGSSAVKPLLEALTKSDLPVGFYQGAHHVLQALKKESDLAETLSPVIIALDSTEPELATPTAALQALQGLADRRVD
jgi:HEAT repeat protein